MIRQPANKRITPSRCHGRKSKELEGSILVAKYPMPMDKKDIPKIHNITQRLILMPGLSKRRTEVIFEESPSSPAFL